MRHAQVSRALITFDRPLKHPGRKHADDSGDLMEPTTTKIRVGKWLCQRLEAVASKADA